MFLTVISTDTPGFTQRHIDMPIDTQLSLQHFCRWTPPWNPWTFQTTSWVRTVQVTLRMLLRYNRKKIVEHLKCLGNIPAQSQRCSTHIHLTHMLYCACTHLTPNGSENIHTLRETAKIEHAKGGYIWLLLPAGNRSQMTTTHTHTNYTLHTRYR